MTHSNEDPPTHVSVGRRFLRLLRWVLSWHATTSERTMTPDGHPNYPLDTSRTQRTRFDNNSSGPSPTFGYSSLCLQKDNPATSVAHFCTAFSTGFNSLKTLRPSMKTSETDDSFTVAIACMLRFEIMITVSCKRSEVPVSALHVEMCMAQHLSLRGFCYSSQRLEPMFSPA
jgi:hypothetical protein